MTQERMSHNRFVRRTGNVVAVIENLDELTSTVTSCNEDTIFARERYDEQQQPHLESAKAEVIVQGGIRILHGEIMFSPIDGYDHTIASIAKLHKYLLTQCDYDETPMHFESFDDRDGSLKIEAYGLMFHIYIVRSDGKHVLNIGVELRPESVSPITMRSQVKAFTDLWAELHDGIIQNPLVHDSPYPIVDIGIHVDSFQLNDEALSTWLELSVYEKRQQEAAGNLPRLTLDQIDPNLIVHLLGGFDIKLLHTVINTAIHEKMNDPSGVYGNDISEDDFLAAITRLQNTKCAK